MTAGSWVALASCAGETSRNSESSPALAALAEASGDCSCADWAAGLVVADRLRSALSPKAMPKPSSAKPKTASNNREEMKRFIPVQLLDRRGKREDGRWEGTTVPFIDISGGSTPMKYVQVQADSLHFSTWINVFWFN